ncbi:MAG: hypothetical protein Q9168_002767 [Polycauliona sp. 1 TL-2023]
MQSDAQSRISEDADMANAIRASLEIGRNDLPRAQDRWIPQSEDDWKTYRRQQKLIEHSQLNADINAEVTRDMEVTGAVDEGSELKRPKTESVHLLDTQVPLFESDGKTYRDQQQPAPGAQSLWSLESRSISSKRPRDEDSHLWPSKGDPRAPKTADEWTMTIEEIRQQLDANQQISESHRGEEPARKFDFNKPKAKDAPSAARSSPSWRHTYNFSEENTLHMQAGQKVRKSDQGETQASSSGLQSHPPENAPSENIPPLRMTIEDRIKEMQEDSVVELEWTEDYVGDTFIYIDPPAKQPEQTDRMHSRYVQRYQRPLVTHSTILRALHSPFFDKLLGPTAQFRTIRRRHLNGPLPERIKYVIDLTPPSEGENAAWLMTELCCVDGIRNWQQSTARWDCSTTLVGGKDEFMELPPGGVAPELSPIRHRSSIERVLNAIRGIDPKLDSAVKVYTTFTVARFFEITQSPLTDYIVRWLRAYPNSIFIEALPEIALKIGDGLRCHDLIRDPFAILVGEEALAIFQDKNNLSYTVSGRKKNDVPEAYQTRIEYASRSFNERVSQTFENLVEPEMTWMETLPEMRKLSNDDHESRELLVKETKTAIKAFVRGAIYGILWSDLQSAPKYDLGNSNCGENTALYPWPSRTELWNSLSESARLMTTTFWTVVKIFFTNRKFANATNIAVCPMQDDVWDVQLSAIKRDTMMQKHGVVEIRWAYVATLIARCCWDSEWSSTGLIKPLEYQFKFPMWDPSAKRGKEAAKDPEPDHITWEDLEITANLREAVKMTCYSDGIDLDEMKLWREIEEYISSICHQMLGPPDLDNRDEPMKQIMTPTLVSLGEEEWKYLPLYAGGLDDESGGVFNDDVPMAETGFSTAGPGVHTGTGSSDASSDYDFVGGQELESTHHTSTMTNNSFSDHLDHRKVYTDDSDLWDHIQHNKNLTSTISGSKVAPSTIDAESEDDFVLPLRPRGSGAGTFNPVTNGHDPDMKEDAETATTSREDYSDLFTDADQDLEDDDNDDDDDDTATEKGENDSDTDAEVEQRDGDSEDEDMVLV